ncbi:MAG: DUF4838 domain-containing protein, partial [Clostridia bacterium]|nr:DUF4838 domain-containing protein [Clostridia bacterium]
AFEDGYTYTDKVDFKCMTLDIDGYKFSTGNYYSEWGCNLPHQIGNLMNGNWEKGIYANTWDNPCFTDPANKASLIENVGKLLELNKTLNLVGLIQNDSSGICKCTDCAKVYRDYGTRGAAMLLLINEVCEAYEEIYPNVKFATWNYTWAEKPPVGMTLHENILLYYNTLILCPAHDYGDPECEHNDVVIERLEAWSELTTPNMFMWEHSNATEAPLTPFPNLNNMRNNIELFASYGINGVFLNGANSHSDEWEFSDFNSMRGYLFSQLFRNAFMSEEEYDYRINSYLKAVYGDGYKSLRSYLDLIDKLGDTQCHTLHSSTKGYYNFDEVIRYIDTIDGYWKTAKAVATEEQLYLIEQAELSWLYLKQCALYDSQYTNGDTASKALYMENNEKLYTQMEKYGKYQLTWGHPSDKSPEAWW